MRILLIHNRYKNRGGEDTVFEEECNILRENGHSVETIEFTNDTLETFSQILKVGISSFYNFSSAALLNKKIEYFKPDVIHVHNLFYVASPSIFFIAKRKKIPIVITLHNYRLVCAGAMLTRNSKPCELCINKKFPLSGIKYGCYVNPIMSAQLTLMTGIHKLIGTWTKKVSKYIVLTDFAKNKILNSSLQLSHNQIFVKPYSSIDLGYQAFDERKDFYLFIGRITKEKGIETLLEATNLCDFNLEIVGDGVMNDIVNSFVSNNPKIIFHGLQNKKYVLEKLKNCKALIVPSTWYEGLPMTILEAFSTGTPVIVSDIDNLNTIVTDGLNGLHFKYNNPESLKNIINYFEGIKDKQHFYQNARETYEKQYTPEKNYNTLLKIYKEVLEKK